MTSLRARSADMKAVAALQATGRYLGLGLGSIIHGLNPARVYIGGEITAAWPLIEPPMRAALVERTLTDEAAATVIQPSKVEHARLNRAGALVAHGCSPCRAWLEWSEVAWKRRALIDSPAPSIFE